MHKRSINLFMISIKIKNIADIKDIEDINPPSSLNLRYPYEKCGEAPLMEIFKITKKTK